ncbi:M56 family metallopeptidase [Prosthecobacter sp.]|uniref:M56 family metallopeptidase n=1 Tax=Prosthecobacter sp. TaxID=1965333 RepID=UPI001E00F5A7|nr:M56 family metallopeptidase [Prosthecobacter sp.]MCB1276613.1 hypothetical protein [Prosthecobacter sp.]
MNSDVLLHWLLRTSVEASILILAVLGLRMMLGTRLSPAWRIGLWMLVGAKLMLPAFIPAGFGLGSWLQKDNAAVATPAAVTPIEFMAPSTPVVSPVEPSIASSASKPSSAFTLTQVLLVTWLVGVAAVFAIAFIRQQRFNALLRRRPRASQPLLRALVASLSHKAGVKKAVSVVLMPAGTTPAMVGIRQPKLLLPEDWDTRFDESSLKHVVLHELLHVRQRDLLWNWVATAVQALHWFNPLVWFVVSRFQADRELRCDAGALEILAPSERLDYGHTLLRIQETFFAPPAIAGLAPCVRNHPTLRQRILMIATPTTRQPVLQALLVLTLGTLVCYSFTTARAAEKEVPPKVRGGETPRSAETGKPATGEREGGEKKPGMREGDGARKSAEREGDGARKSAEREGDGARKPGMRDGDGARKTGEGDGDKPRTGTREGDGAKKTGMRDGDRPRTGEREGDKPRTGGREGEGSRKTGARDGDRSTSSGETITLKVIKNGDVVMVGDEEVAMGRLRGHLSTFLPDHPGARIEVTGDDDVPLKALHNTVDAVRDNGNKNVGIATK